MVFKPNKKAYNEARLTKGSKKVEKMMFEHMSISFVS